MNFKPNAWTLLFALALGALLFNMYGSKEADKKDVADVVATLGDCNGHNPTEITSAEADTMEAKYLRYLEYNAEILESLKTSSTPVENPDVFYFRIPKCELQNMVTSIPGGHVIAHLGIKPNPKSGEPMLDLYFSDKDMTMSSTGEILAAKGGDGGAKYWDFTHPCPTLCNE